MELFLSILTAEQLTGMIFQQNSTDLKEMPWFRAVEGFSDAKSRLNQKEMMILMKKFCLECLKKLSCQKLQVY